MEQIKKKIGIVGGGKVGLKMFNLFHNNNLSEVIFVVDVNPAAPARQAASQAGITTFGTLDDIGQHSVDFIIEVTGVAEVVEHLTHLVERRDDHLQVITHDMAYIILQVIEENNHRSQQAVMQDVDHIQHKMQDNLQTVEKLVQKIESVTAEMRILSLNARIEAARAGEQGKGFAVVAEQMAKSVDAVRDVAVQIDKVNKNVQDTTQEIQTTIERLN